MNTFISTVYKETRQFPCSKGIETATYRLPPVIQQRIADKAKACGYLTTEVEDRLIIEFKD